MLVICMSNRNRNAIVRKFRIVFLLQKYRYGSTVKRLVEITNVHRSTIYRDLGILIDAGARINKRVVNGEVRYTFCGVKSDLI